MLCNSSSPHCAMAACMTGVAFRFLADCRRRPGLLSQLSLGALVRADSDVARRGSSPAQQGIWSLGTYDIII